MDRVETVDAYEGSGDFGEAADAGGGALSRTRTMSSAVRRIGVVLGAAPRTRLLERSSRCKLHLLLLE